MSDPRKPPSDTIADANSLFDDDDDDDEPSWGGKPSHTPRAKPVQPASKEAHPPKPVQQPAAAVPLGGEYDVEGLEPDDDLPPVPRTPVQPARAKAAEGSGERRPRPSVAASRPDSDDDLEERRTPDPESNVDEIWTRWGEWGPALTKMGIALVITLGLSYVIASSVGAGTAFLILLAGLALVVALSYPIAVTLERPMRLTPEQAVKDFYAAASHHFPQYRRMWLLLSDQGRDCAEFDSYAGFRSYWLSRMARIRGNSIKKFTPLTFVIKEFRSDKSAGQTAIDAEYTIAVRARGATGGPAEECPIEGSLVRGPDKMWYLNSGVLPEVKPASRERRNT